MAVSQRLVLPSRDPLPHSLRLPSEHPLIFKTLARLSRASLLKLAQEWCSKPHRANCAPYLNQDYEPDDAEAPWSALNTIEELVQLYTDELATRKGTKRELLDRILEGDWRHGITLQQLAMAECQILMDNPSSLSWTAFKLNPYRDDDLHEHEAHERVPHLHAPSFILSMHQQIAALTKAHYHVFRPADLPVTIIRIALYDTPYSRSAPALVSDLISTSKSVFLAFPDSAPFVYVSLPAIQALKEVDAEARSLQAFIVKAVPIALSQPLERYQLHQTKLSARSLAALLAMRGAQKEAGVNGGWSIYAEDEMHSNALCVKTGDTENEPSLSEDGSLKQGVKRTFSHLDPPGHLSLRERKQLKTLAQARFGQVGGSKDQKILSSFNVQLKELGGNQTHWQPSVRLKFQGTHVFQGMRRLTETGVIDARSMPSWLTGEANISSGTVSDGKIDVWYDHGNG